MLFERLARLSQNDVLVLDRGYDTSRLIAALQACGIHFGMSIAGSSD